MLSPRFGAFNCLVGIAARDFQWEEALRGQVARNVLVVRCGFFKVVANLLVRIKNQDLLAKGLARSQDGRDLIRIAGNQNKRIRLAQCRIAHDRDRHIHIRTLFFELVDADKAVFRLATFTANRRTRRQDGGVLFVISENDLNFGVKGSRL